MSNANQSDAPAFEGAMYKLKPLFDSDAHVDIPECMYKMNSVYSLQTSALTSANASSCLRDGTAKSEVSLEALEKRQNDILVRLDTLQKQVKDLVSKAGPAVVKTAPQQQSSRNSTLCDLVITANPQSPPASLFVLGRMLANQYPVLLSTFVHSSTSTLVNQHLLDVFKTEDGLVTSRGAFQLAITVIWKDGQHNPTLIVKPGQQVPISGEANVSRYLARLLADRYDSTDIIRATQIDSALDVAADILQSNGDNVSSVVTLLRGSKTGWLFGYARHSLADVVVWSAVKQRCSGKKLPNDVCQWVNRCDQLPEFSYATQLFV